MTNFYSTDLYTRTSKSYDKLSELSEKLEPLDDAKIKSVKPILEYNRDVNKYLSLILDNFELLSKIKLMIENLPNSDRLEDMEMTLGNYIDFTVQNFYIRLYTIEELVFLLSSKIIRLGIQDGDLSPKHILKNQLYKDEPFVDVIKSLQKLLQPYRTKRNTVVHRGFITHETVDKFKGIYDDLYNPDTGISIGYYEAEVEKYRVELLTEFDSIISDVETLTKNFLDSIGGIYEDIFENILIRIEKECS